jgi:hypothetical protein
MVTRFIVKWYLPALDKCVCLQKRTWYGWKTIAWIQVSVCAYFRDNRDSVERWLWWSYNEEQQTKEKKIELMFKRNNK